MGTQQLTIKDLRIQFDWKIALIATLAFSILMTLGVWQLKRAAEKRSINFAIEQRQQLPPTPLELITLQNREQLKGLRVSLDGQYLHDRSIIIEGQVFRGQLGVEIITPFLLQNNDEIILVSRGWVAVGLDDNPESAIDGITGDQRLIAQLHIPASKSFFEMKPLGKAKWPVRLHHFDFQIVKKLFKIELFPYVARLDSNVPGVLERHWRIKKMDPDINTSYALQWFAMSLILLCAVVIACSNIIELLHSKSDRAEV
ncbi:MAG: SURF1 family protein [Pseudomonadales bacterium]